MRSAGPLGRNVLVMPVYNEDTDAVFHRLAAMSEDLAANGLGAHFDIMVLSDTRTRDIAAAEMAAAQRLRARMRGRVAIHYRLRADNRHRKAGNIHDPSPAGAGATTTWWCSTPTAA